MEERGDPQRQSLSNVLHVTLSNISQTRVTEKTKHNRMPTVRVTHYPKAKESSQGLQMLVVERKDKNQRACKTRLMKKVLLVKNTLGMEIGMLVPDLLCKHMAGCFG